MVPDCIDPKVGGFLREVMNKSVQENVSDWGGYYSFEELWEARLHWNGCPACRPEFTGVPAFFAQIGTGIDNTCRDVLSDFRDKYLREKETILSAAKDLPSAYAEIIVLWALCEGDVLPFLAHGQEVLRLRVSSDSPEEPEPSLRGWEGPLSSCREFIYSLEFSLQRFVYGVYWADDLLMPVRQKMDSEYAETGRLRFTVEAWEDLQQRMQAAIANSQLEPSVLLTL